MGEGCLKMRFRDLPAEARRYIIYHTLTSPILIVWYALPFYLLITGYTVLEVGVIFTAAQILGIPLTLWLGRVFTRADIRKGLMTIDILGSISIFFYYLAYGPIAPLMVLIGQLIDEASGTLYFLYPAYERIIYPEDRMKEALTWHLRLPELAIIISYPIIGFTLGYLCPSTTCFRNLFLLLTLYELALVPYIYFLFKPVVLERIENSGREGKGLRDYWGRYKYYVIADILFITAWNLAPSLALVYYVMEWLRGNMFHVTLIEAVISTATLTGTWLVDRVSEGKAFKALQAGTIVSVAGLALMVLTRQFILILLAAYILRLGDTFVFVFKRAWLFKIMSKAEASKVSAALSSLRRGISVVSPIIVGALAYIDPRTPYIACLTLLLLTIPVYAIASRSIRYSDNGPIKSG